MLHLSWHICTGCPAVGVSTLNVHIYFMAEPMRKPFNSMKVETGRICLVYRTPCKIIFFTIYTITNFHKFFLICSFLLKGNVMILIFECDLTLESSKSQFIRCIWLPICVWKKHFCKKSHFKSQPSPQSLYCCRS